MIKFHLTVVFILINPVHSILNVFLINMYTKLSKCIVFNVKQE
jgi:hypothetical protein